MVHSKKPSVSEFHTVAVSLNAMQQSFSYHVSVGDNGCLLYTSIIQYAKDTLQKNINDNIYVSLTDHINFAIERVEMGVPFQNPFLWEIKKFYYQEYLIGKVAIGMIEKELKVTLPQDLSLIHI